MHLLIVRHGEAELSAASDDVRNLTQRGRDATAALARALIKKSFKPTQIWASPLVRAQQTAAILQKQLAFTSPIRECRAAIPEGDVRECTALLQHENADDIILLASHQPFVTQLISWLCNATLQAGSDVPTLATSAAILLHLPLVDTGCARREWTLFPPLFQPLP